ncbi:hypothetical protein J6590_082935 [Homalodisca vitripennis]|nr:hypothetical protein J6590_082935 [Homalodisca vitripennis]
MKYQLAAGRYWVAECSTHEYRCPPALLHLQAGTGLLSARHTSTDVRLLSCTSASCLLYGNVPTASCRQVLVCCVLDKRVQMSACSLARRLAVYYTAMFLQLAAGRYWVAECSIHEYRCPPALMHTG